MRWISDRTTMGKFINTMDFITWIADILNFGLKWTGVTRFFSIKFIQYKLQNCDVQCTVKLYDI